MSVIRVGLLGFGTVGTGVVNTVRAQEKKLTERLGKRVEIVKVLVRDVTKTRQIEVENDLLTDRFAEVLESDIDVLVEVIGGVEPAYQYIAEALKQGCHVVTANKELLAKCGNSLINLANQYQVHFAYESSGAGGIPNLGVLHHFQFANEITSVQRFADMDPMADVEGFDPQYELYLLSQLLLFGEAPPLNSVAREGISQLTICQLQFARALGYRMKLLAQASKTDSDLDLSVKLTLLPLDHPLASIQDTYKAVQVTGNTVIEDLAYLLSQPYIRQPEWREGRTSKSCRLSDITTEMEKRFFFLEAKDPTLTPYQVIHFLQSEGVRIHKQKTEFNAGEVIRIGMIAEGFNADHVAALQESFQLQIKQFPIFENGDLQKSEEQGRSKFEREELVIDQLV
ncbi:homoserine dehydrogenase [Brevibacillus antibioticus]|uniref:Homoserine dehydrogenase n=1 Tax=Brevibacillus antibioticus TaxID=2570228 RepID=A0A4U2Y4N0_9BACL|nr:homoserine dehydrogenase [Brevibacillus antibioticus]TKI55064.1 homoserine dehydrogenase [Brevibacillus antibioticus]